MRNTWRTRASAAGAGRRLDGRMLAIILLALASPALRAQEGELARAKWIWSAADAAAGRPTGERIFVRRAFRAPADAPFRLEVTADNHYRAWIDGRPVLAGDDWAAPGTVEGRLAADGEDHVLAVEAWNDGGPAGLIFALRVDGRAPSLRVVSDTEARVSNAGPEGWTAIAPAPGEWSPAVVAADFGGGPWGRPRAPRPPSFRPRQGFVVETVAEGVGSLIAMGRESDDRLWVSRESGGLLRLDRDAEGRFVTGLELPAYSYAQGLAFAAGRLFLTGFGPQGLGLYSVDPATGEGRRLARLEGAGEHGPHGIVVRGDRLWVTLGNHCRLVEPWAADSPYRGWYEGTILEAMPDPRGHANGILAPGGIIFSTDFEGTAFRVEAGGMRNVYDLAFDARGELFAFDADMEWDIGLPWYRPVRLYHVAPGAEFGWRQGSGKWPRAFADALPPVLEVGRGSPTGLVTYDGDSFPTAFRGAIFGADWSRGRILSFRVTPHGQGYLGRSETLLEGQPMNVTDLVVDGTGDLLFSCGGRGTRGGVYRLRYVGPGLGVSAPAADPSGASRSEDRTRLPLAELWRRLDLAEDRTARYLAARELERRGNLTPPEGPRPGPLALAEADLAAVRLDRRTGRAPADRAAALLRGLAAAATPEERALRLRALALLVERFPDRLDAEGARTLASIPADSEPVLEELRAAILVRTAPTLAREGLLDRLAAAKTDERRIAAAELLSRLGAAADAESDAEALEALARARGLPGGASYEGFLERAARRILDRAGSEELNGVWAAHAPGGEGLQRRDAAGAPRDARRLVAVLRGLLESPSRDPREGRLVFERACATCHRCGAAGNAVGPDLGDVAARFGLADLVTAVVEPDRDVSDQYPGLLLDLEDGRSLLGLLAAQSDDRVTIVTTEGKREEIPVAAIRDRRTTRSSIMPAGLFDELSPVAIADLIAFLREPDVGAERPEESTWSDLFDGKTFDGFAPDEERWRIEGGVLIGAAKGLTESRFLVSEEEWSDFRLEAEVLVVRGNSGIQFRSTLLRPGVLGGYQADLGETWWGSLYEERGRGVLVQADAALWEPTLDRGGWNHLLVEALGEEIAISLNGVPTVVLRDSGASRGRIGLQLHAGEGTEVHFRNLRLQSHDKNPVSGH